MRALFDRRRHAFVLTRLAFALVILVIVVGSAVAEPLAVHTVTSIADGGPGTLRQAMLDANASVGGDVIEFNLSGCSPACVIHPTIALPVITDGRIVIDGFSQPGSAPPTAASAAVIRVALDGTDVENNNGLSITSGGNEVKGLAIYRFGWNGVAIGGPDARSNRVWGNHIGLSAGGLGRSSRRANGFEGVFLGLGAQSNTIGGDMLTQRNVISGNGYDGVAIHGPNTRFNRITGNFIGLDASGTNSVPNSWDGVRLYGGSAQNRVGVIDDLDQRNIISGNDRDGVRMVGADTGASLDGNLIGTTADGFSELGNEGDGVHMMDGAAALSMGAGDTPSIGLVSGNGGHGIHLESGQVVVMRHFVGVDASGLRALPNDIGIRVTTGDVLIGGPTRADGNLVSGNRSTGIVLTGRTATGCALSNNGIGVNVTGTGALGNGTGGIRILAGAHDNQVGGVDVGNVVSGNAGSGIEVDGSGTTGNKILGNTIGVSADGETPLGNAGTGVYIRGGAAGTRVGGLLEGHGNWIASNSIGLLLQNAGTGTQVLANRIGAGESGVSRGFGNGGQGVKIEDGTVGARFEGNSIVRNSTNGVHVHGAPTLGNIFVGESIYDNGTDGIRLQSGAHGDIRPPRLAVYHAPSLTVTGTGCAGCTAAIYSDDADEGREYLASGVVLSDGKINVALPHAPSYANITATVSDATLGTSEFSVPLAVVASTATPTVTGITTPTTTPTPTSTGAVSITPTRTATAGPSPTASPTASATATGSVTTYTPTTTPPPTPTAEQTLGPTLPPTAAPTFTRPPSRTPSSTLTPSPTVPSTTPTSRPDATNTPTATDDIGTDSFQIWLPFAARGIGPG